MGSAGCDTNQWPNRNGGVTPDNAEGPWGQDPTDLPRS
jgi:hypothetical protein